MQITVSEQECGTLLGRCAKYCSVSEAPYALPPVSQLLQEQQTCPEISRHSLQIAAAVH